MTDQLVLNWKTGVELLYVIHQNKIPDIRAGYEPVTDIIMTKNLEERYTNIWYYYDIDAISDRKWSAILRTMHTSYLDYITHLSTAVDLSLQIGLPYDDIHEIPALWVLSVEFIG